MRFLGGTGWTRGHPYSLSAAPDGRRLRITVKDLGDGSAALRRLRPGTRVLVEGPYGRLSARARTRRKVALIGAGVGVTPLRALAEELDYAPGEAVLLYRFTDRPLFQREFEALADERGLQVLWLPGHRPLGGLLAGAGVGAGQRPDRADLLGARHRPARRLRLRPEEWAEDVRRTHRGRGPARRAVPRRELRLVTA